MKISALPVYIITAIILLASAARSENFTKGTEEAAFTADLKAGDCYLEARNPPTGPVVIIVSLPEQRLYVFRNGVRIGRSTISTGKAGHRTPTGVFTVLEKNVKHTSSIYKGASMPYMQRLTWGGVAMHAGQLPGYPASHGCVRLPLDFAEKLYTVTGNGTTVIVTDGKAAPGTTSQPGLLLSGKTGEAAPALAPGAFTWTPEKSPAGPVSIIVSSADRMSYVYRNGVEIGRASIGGDTGSYGSYVYSALAQKNSDGSPIWSALGTITGSQPPDIKGLAKRLAIPPAFLAGARSVITPGTTLIITDQPVNDTTRSNTGFNIMTAEAPSR